MKRYCVNCKKEYEFEPVLVSGREDLICPQCGRIVDKNSRRPVDHSASDNFERQVGHVYARLMQLAYLYYITLALIGGIGYLLHWDKLLFVVTGLSLLTFVIQLMYGSCRFRMGVLFLPIGGIIGFFLLGGITGACVGIHLVFLIRHLVRDVLFSLVRWLIREGNR